VCRFALFIPPLSSGHFPARQEWLPICVPRYLSLDQETNEERGENPCCRNGVSMSPLGYKRKSGPCCRHVRLSPNRRPSLADVRYRADFVRFTPQSRRGSGRPRESVPDPQRTLRIELSGTHDVLNQF
jgi:hypothetical protein